MNTLAPAPPATGFARFMLEHQATAVLLFDETLNLVSLNPAAEELLDISGSKLCGIEADRLFPDAGVFLEAISRAIALRQPTIEREMELRVGESRCLSVDCSLTPLGDAAPTGGLLVEMMALDRHRRISREEQLVNQNETARTLVRRLAHEIRNPLGGLRGAAQLLERELVDDALKEYTYVIIHEADRLQKLMDRMLGPRSRPNMRWFSIHEVTERVAALIEAEAPPGVRVARDYDPSIPELHADAELLIQAVLNVARNAVQAIEVQGNIRIRTRVHRQFTIGARCHRLVVQIDIADDGPGIPEALRDTLFYPMTTGREGGTGFGLSIAQSLVSQHGGLIECSSEPGRTTFSILLPLEPKT